MWCWGRSPVTDTIHRRKKRYITHLAFSWNPHLRFWNKFLHLRFNLRIWIWHKHWEQVAHNPSDSIKYPKWLYACRIVTWAVGCVFSCILFMNSLPHMVESAPLPPACWPHHQHQAANHIALHVTTFIILCLEQAPFFEFKEKKKIIVLIFAFRQQ